MRLSANIKLVALFGVLGALCLNARAASAQALPVLGNPGSISAGVFLPSGGDAKRHGGSNQLYVDLKYGLPVSVPLTPTRTIVDVGAEFGSSSGSHSTIVPITIGEFIGANGKGPFSANNFYAGVGVGAYLENQSGISSAARVGGYGAIGYNIGSEGFLEAKYQIVDHGNGGLIGAGLRF